MGLFKKKKETEAPDKQQGERGENNLLEGQAIKPEGTLEVLVLGSGCKKCNQLEENTKVALNQLGVDASVGHITDFAQIAAYGVMSTPALVVNGKVVLYGKVAKVEEVANLLKNAGV